MSQPLAGKPFYFDDCVVGDEHAAASHTVTAQEIIEFAQTWDPQPWHIDEAAAKDSHFGALTACSAHIFSIFCITSQRWKSGEGFAQQTGSRHRGLPHAIDQPA